MTDDQALDAEREASGALAAARRARVASALLALAAVWAALAAGALAGGLSAFSSLGPGAGAALWQLWLVGFALDAAAQALRPLGAALAALAASCLGAEAAVGRLGRGSDLDWLERFSDALSVSATLPVGRRLRWADRVGNFLHFTRRVG